MMKQLQRRLSKNFINRFQKGAMPDEMPEFTFEGEIGLATLLKESEVKFNDEINRSLICPPKVGQVS